MARGTRGAYRREDRVALPADLQKELVEKAAAKYGNCQELAKHLDIPKSSVHYYRIGRLTMPVSVLNHLLEIADDDRLRDRIEAAGVAKDRSWATEYAQDIFREMCREKVVLPTKQELATNDDLRRKAAAIVSYVLAEGSVWIHKNKCGEGTVNITFADHEDDLYEHFRSLSREVFRYDIGKAQEPGNEARAIRGFIYSRFVAEWFMANGVPQGEKASQACHLPPWVMNSRDEPTWISALQPWCDGEGSAQRSPGSKHARFSLAQSRHTKLDVNALPSRCGSIKMERTMGISDMASRVVLGIPLMQYCESKSRSEVFDDVHHLFRRLGLNPELSVASMYLKDDGFWSCNWRIAFTAGDSERLLGFGLIRQLRKLEAMRPDKQLLQII